MLYRGDMKVRLRPLMLGDATRIFYANKGNVKTYVYDFRAFRDAREWTLATLEDITRGLKEEYCIFYHGRLAGMTGFWLSDHQCAEVVIWLDPDYQGKGIAIEALRALEAIMKRRGVMQALYLCDNTNLHSCRLALASGYNEKEDAISSNARLFYKQIA